jgi:hypothetical protein
LQGTRWGTLFILFNALLWRQATSAGNGVTKQRAFFIAYFLVRHAL